MSNLPNIITILRIVLVLPTAWMLWESRFLEAFVLMVVAGVSDALDGFLARRFGWMSKLGASLDPLADKFLVAAIFIVFTYQGHIPVWLALIVLFRDFMIVIGAGVFKLLYEEVEISPTLLSKANTAMQFVTLCLLMGSFLPLGLVADIAAGATVPCFYILAVLGVSSGLDYMVIWGSKAHRAGQKSKLYKHGRGAFRRLD